MLFFDKQKSIKLLNFQFSIFVFRYEFQSFFFWLIQIGIFSQKSRYPTKNNQEIYPMIIKFVNKIDDITEYLFPDHHIVTLHRSAVSTPTLIFTRILSLIYLSYIYVWSITMTKSALNNFIYLTMQGFFVTWLYFLLAIQDYFLNKYRGKGKRSLSKNLKYYIQIVYEIAFCIELPITIIFWGVLFKILLDMKDVTAETIAMNANLHGAPFILLFVDLIFNSFTFPRQHFHTVLVFGLIYAIINLIYTLVVHIIYQPIDWVSVMSYVLLAGTVIMTFVMHWLGRFIFNKCKRDKISLCIETKQEKNSKIGRQKEKKRIKGSKEKSSLPQNQNILSQQIQKLQEKAQQQRKQDLIQSLISKQ